MVFFGWLLVPFDIIEINCNSRRWVLISNPIIQILTALIDLLSDEEVKMPLMDDGLQVAGYCRYRAIRSKNTIILPNKM